MISLRVCLIIQIIKKLFHQTNPSYNQTNKCIYNTLKFLIHSVYYTLIMYYGQKNKNRRLKNKKLNFLANDLDKLSIFYLQQQIFFEFIVEIKHCFCALKANKFLEFVFKKDLNSLIKSRWLITAIPLYFFFPLRFKSFNCLLAFNNQYLKIVPQEICLRYLLAPQNKYRLLLAQLA